jgi:hypothetical protein
MPWNFARFKGESLKIVLNDSSVNSSHSLVERLSISGMGVNCISLCDLAETVPWTNILANIAAKHPVLKFAFHVAGYQAVF